MGTGEVRIPRHPMGGEAATMQKMHIGRLLSYSCVCNCVYMQAIVYLFLRANITWTDPSEYISNTCQPIHLA